MVQLATRDVAPFGAELRRYRAAAGLTQEELAERAGLSARGIQDIESGLRRMPRKNTVQRLAAALREPETTTNSRVLLPASSFVGREADVAELQRRVRDTRLLTITGIGGIGKTRLALEVAAVVGQDVERVGIADLSLCHDAQTPVQLVANALTVREQPFRPLLETIAEVIGDRRILLLFDNCEHQLDECVELVDPLLLACPNLRVLATSREPLHITAEVVWSLDPLEVLGAHHEHTLDTLSAHGATRLFLERARAVTPRLPLDQANLEAIGAICRRLEGNPLAIELAAARTPLFTPCQIADRLDDAVPLLCQGSRTAPSRHQSLEAAINWSYGLLSPAEQRLFEQLSVFAGGWTIEAALVLADAGSRDVETIHLLGGLVDKSLVIAEPTSDRAEIRYRLLDVLRQFAEMRLRAHAEDVDGLRGRHATYFLDLVEQAETAALATDRKAWLDRVEVELDNVRLALRWFEQCGDGESAQRLAACLYRMLVYRGHADEGRQCLVSALDVPHATDATRAKALHFLGSLAWTQADYPTAARCAEDALALRRNVGDQCGIAWSLSAVGAAAMMRGQHAIAEAAFAQAHATACASGDRYILGLNLALWAHASYLRGDAHQARAHADEAMYVATANNFESIVSMAHVMLGRLKYVAGDRDGARRALECALAHAETLNEAFLVARATLCLAQVEADNGDGPRARALLIASIRAGRRLGNAHHLAHTIEAVSVFAAHESAAAHALQFSSAAANIRRALDTPLGPIEARLLGNGIARAYAVLTPNMAECARDAGRGMTLDEACATALEFLERGT